MKRLLATGLVLSALVVLPATDAAPPKPPYEHSPGVGTQPATGRTASGVGSALATALARARLATAKYATNLAAAKAAGYRIITPMIPNMGYHYMNPKITGFGVAKPPILVYLKRGNTWQLGALEWVWPAKPTTQPLPGATFGAFGAACHYADGTFVPAASQDACAKTSAGGAAFGFWHPNLVTMHVWLWYPNPAGIYSGTNPLVQPFNEG